MQQGVCNCSWQGNYNRLKFFLQQKTFSKEELVEIIHSLVGKALEYTSAEQQVLKNNIDFIFSYFLANYLKLDLITERPHDFNLLVKDFPRVYKTLAELYRDKNSLWK